MPSGPVFLRQSWFLLSLYALGYALAFEVGLALYLMTAPVSALWPASGYALGILLVAPRIWWGRLLLVQAVIHAVFTMGHGNVSVAIGATIADVLEAFLGAWLITRWCGGPVRLDDPAHVVRLIAGAVGAVAPCAVIGALTIWWAHGNSDLLGSGRVWLLGDLLGILVMTPAVIAVRYLRRDLGNAHRGELLLAIIVLAALTWGVGFHQPGTISDPLLRPALIWMPMLWIGLRCGPMVTALAAAGAALALVAGASVGLGPFVEPMHSATDLSLTTQVFVGVLCSGTLLIASSAAGRRHAMAAAIATAERLHITLASIGDGVIAIDSQGHVERLNPMATQLTGWSEDDARGRALAEVFPLTGPPEGLVVINPVERALHKGVTFGLDDHAELVHRDGSRRRIADSAAPIRNAAGAIVGAVLVFRDMTERHRLEERLRQTEKLEAIGRLSSGIAHDLNNMIGGVMGGAELLQGRVGDDERVQKPVRMILASAQRMGELNARLLSFARSEPAARRTFPVDRLVEDCAELLRHGFEQHQVEVACAAGDQALVSVDRSQFQSALLNLAINGRDAMADGGILRITTARRHQDGRDEVLIAVCDHGSGMTPTVRAHLFEPFFTTKPVGLGTGLGLHAVQTCMRAHDGAIAIETEPGAGTTVTLILPMIAGSAAPEPVPVSGALRVLVVDDDSALLAATTAQLEDAGYRVVSACDGIAGLEALSANGPFDLVVLDVVMPRMDGLAMLRVLRQDHPELPVLLVSGRLPDIGLRDLFALGPTALLAKPYRLAALRSAIDELLSAGG